MENEDLEEINFLKWWNEYGKKLAESLSDDPEQIIKIKYAFRIVWSYSLDSVEGALAMAGVASTRTEEDTYYENPEPTNKEMKP